MRRLYPKNRAFVFSVALILFCFAVSVNAAENLLNVYVVNYPLKYFAERIGEPHVNVMLPVPPDEDPVYWTPKIEDISAFQQGDLILLNGAGYAKWVSKATLPRSKTMDTSSVFKDRYVTETEITTHSHGGEGEHAHEGLAFTTWLDLSLAARQAESVYKAFLRKRPELKSKFKANYLSLEKDLLTLDSRIKEIVAKNPSTPIIVSHPVYEYMIQGYGLNARSVHFEPDQVPTDNQLFELKKLVESHPARWMLWEGGPSKAAVKKLKAIGIQSTVFNPCGNVPQQGDFISVMQQNVTNLEQVFP